MKFQRNKCKFGKKLLGNHELICFENIIDMSSEEEDSISVKNDKISLQVLISPFISRGDEWPPQRFKFGGQDFYILGRYYEAG